MVGDQKSSSPLVPPCVPPGLAWSHLIVSPGVGAPLPLLCTLLTPVSAGLGPGLRAESGVSSYSSRVSAAACVREREVRGDTGGGWVPSSTWWHRPVSAQLSAWPSWLWFQPSGFLNIEKFSLSFICLHTIYLQFSDELYSAVTVRW